MIEPAGKLESIKEKVSDLCSIVDRAELTLIGIGIPVSFESQGYPNPNHLSFESATMNDAFIARKYITDGTIAFLAEILGTDLKNTEIISAFDHSRKVIARFRQANSASVFVPVRRKSVM